MKKIIGLGLLAISVTSFAAQDRDPLNCRVDTESPGTVKMVTHLGKSYKFIAYCRAEYTPNNGHLDGIKIKRDTDAGELFNIQTDCPSTLPSGNYCRIWATWKPVRLGFQSPLFVGSYDESGYQTDHIIAITETHVEPGQ